MYREAGRGVIENGLERSGSSWNQDAVSYQLWDLGQSA